MHTLKSKDVFEIEQNDFANRRLTESKDKWDPKSIEGLNGWQKFGKKAERFFDRVWRGMATEDVHRAKEKALGTEFSAIAGIDSAITEEFHSVIDKEARKRLAQERQTGWQKFKGGAKDAWAEFRGARKDLHKHELIITQELRQKYDADPTNSDPLENPLYSLVNRDVAAREAMAARVNESEIELLKQTNVGDKKTVEAIKLEGEKGKKVEDFLKKEIIGKAINDFVTRAEAGQRVTGIEGKLRRELDLSLQDYLITDEFQDWVKTLPEEQQAMFENSFTYASDILLQAEEVMMPSVLENLDHYKSSERLNFEMELCLGTAQLSANTEAKKDGWFTKERASLNKNLMDKLRQERNATSKSRIYDSSVIKDGLKREKMLGYASSVYKNEALMAWTSALTMKGVATAARTGMSWLPVLGSAGVAGTLSGLKEWARMDKNRATYGFGVANGLEFPIADKAIKSAELRAADYNRLQLSDRTQQFQEVLNKINEGNIDANTMFMGMVYAADSQARLKLSGERNVNLLTASVDGPTGRGIHARELRIHDKARAAVMGKLNTLLADSSNLNKVGEIFGLLPGETRDLSSLMDKLTDAQYNNLLSGTVVDGRLKSAITNLDSKLVVQESESVRSRDKIYNAMHWRSSLKYGATSAAIAGVAGLGLGKFFNHEQLISGTENHTVVLVDHDLPVHEDLLPTAHITDNHGNLLAETHSWLPSGTHLEQVSDRVGGPDDVVITYNLVTDNTKDQVLLHGISFGDHGEIINQSSLAEEMAKNHINITPHELTPVGWGVDSTTPLDNSGWHNSIVWGEQPGMSEGGVDGWVAHTLSNHDTPDGVERVTEISGVRQIWKGLQDDVGNNNVHINQIEGYHRVVKYVESINGPQVLSAPQSDNLEITNLPDLIATQAGHEKIASLVDESVRMHAALEPGQELDRLHQVVWEAAYWGDEAHVPHGADLKLILDWAGESTESNLNQVTPIENYFTIDQDLTTIVPVPTEDLYKQTVSEWWTSLAAVGYTHPLEGPRINRQDRLDRKGPYGNYGYGYETTSPETKLFYSGKLSETLKNNPKANLDASVEVPKYIESLDEEYRKQLEEYLDQPGLKEPMENNVEAIVTIPVFTMGEGKVVKTALEQYALQFDKSKNNKAVDPSRVELMLFLNHPVQAREKIESELGHPYTQGAVERVRSNNPEMYDTEEVINQFIAKHPEMRIRIMKKEFDKRPVWGSIIKPFYDVALMRSMNRASPKNNDPLIITNDIDIVDMSPAYLSDMLKEARVNNLLVESNPDTAKIDGWVGKIDMPNHGYEKYPGFLFAERLYQFLDARSRRTPGRVTITQGRSTAVRASSLAAVGGVNPNTDAGADTEIGRMIANARNDASTIKYVNRAWLHSDPRRELDMWKKGIPLAYAWSEWEAMNVYGKDWKDRFNTVPEDPSSLDVETLKREIEAEADRHQFPVNSSEMRLALVSLGMRTKQQLQESIDLIQSGKTLNPDHITASTEVLGLKSGDYHIDSGKIIVDKADFEFDSNDKIVINRVNGVVDSIKKFVEEKRWNRIETRKQNTLNSSE